MMRALQIGFNNLDNQSLLFLTKKVSSQETQNFLTAKFGSSSLIERSSNTLFSFNQQLLKLSCENIFRENPLSFDGAALIKKYSEY